MNTFNITYLCILNYNNLVETPWPSGQGSKASTPRSRIRIPDNAISIGRGLSFNSGEANYEEN